MEMLKLRKALSSELDSTIHNEGSTKLASVMVIIYGEKPTLLMTEKPKHLNIHAGEIAFPGGKWSEQDVDLLDTAIRETQEEIGLQIPKTDVIGQLENVQTLNSGFTITPFVSVLDNIPKLYTNSEVETILHIPLFKFLQTLSDDKDPLHNSIQEMYTLEHESKIIWGASARILKQMAALLEI